MIFKPLGRNIVIEFLEDEKDQDTILLPSDYRPAEQPYEIVRVASGWCGNKCEKEWEEGYHIVVEAHMIRIFDHAEETYYIISENHVIGYFDESLDKNVSNTNP